MSRMPRIIPLTAVAIGGVLAINAVTHGPAVLSAAKAFAEDVGAPKSSVKPAVAANASVASTPAAKPAPVCAPTAAELAKEAGLSPAELQVLQSLGNRRGQLDQRESDLDTQVQLIAAAEAKLDGRIKEMNGLKSDITGLLGQADQQQAAETGRLIRVYEAMAPKDAAGRMQTMDDGVRLPMAAKMKERSLAAILGKMDPDAARILTEKLAHRVDTAQSVANARSALNPPAAPAPAPTKTAQAAATAPDAGAAPAADASTDAQSSAAPKPAAAKAHRVARAKPRPKPAGTTQVAAAKPAAAAPAPTTATAAPATATAKPTPAPAAPTPAAPAPAKTG